MESKLQEAVKGEDWYSAHQIYLALAQKYYRFGRKKDMIGILVDGIVVLSRAKQSNSVVQLVDKLVEYSTPNDFDDFNFCIDKIFESLWDLDQSLSLKVASVILEKNRKVAKGLYSSALKVGCEEAGRYLLFMEEMPATFGDSFLIRENESFFRLVVRSLISKDFKLAGEAIKLKLSQTNGIKKPIDDPSATLASFTTITLDEYLNAAQILFMTCQRKCEKGIYVGLIEQNSWITKIVPDDWLKSLERVYWPSPPSRPSQPGGIPPLNQFAQMFQNLFPPPQQSQQPRPRADDLD
jgi:hypothetical protein